MSNPINGRELRRLLSAKEYEKARCHLGEMDQAGYPGASLQLGWMYEAGEGVEADTEMAQHFYRRAGEHGLGEGYHRLGLIHEEKGEIEKALNIYYLANKNTVHKNSKFRLARLLLEQPNLTQVQEGLAMMREVADQGHLSAKRHLIALEIRDLGTSWKLPFLWMKIGLLGIKVLCESAIPPVREEDSNF